MDVSRTNSENLNIQQTVRSRTTNISDIRRQSSDSHHSVNSSSSEDLDDLCIDHELVDIDEVVAPKKPHFLDYDAVPPPGFENDIDLSVPVNNLTQQSGKINITTTVTATGRVPLLKQKSHESRGVQNFKHQKQMNSNNQNAIPTTSTVGNIENNESQNEIDYPGESVKVDKKFEKDGEISDYELAASGYTKRDLTTSAITSHQNVDTDKNSIRVTQENKPKKKHFLDENPIPPDYMLPFDRDFQREHRSLDRNFERQNEYENIQHIQSTCARYERKHSLERESNSTSGRRIKEPSYSLSRFIESDLILDQQVNHSTWPTMDLKNTVESFNYSSMPNDSIQKSLGPKVECVYSLLSMLGNHDSVEMSKKFFDLSRTPETSATLRRSGCIPLLVQMMHSDSDEGVRKRSAMALHNVVHCHPDDKAGRREAKVLRLIEQIMDYCAFLKTLLQSGGETIADDSDRHPLAAISSLMKVSFDEEHRHAMCQLGALQAIASLVHLDHAAHGPKPEDQCCNSLRRYALMALTNLTFGDGNNKALLCANKDFMEALVAQLDTAPDDLLQVTASVLRNLSWRADNNMKSVLNEIGTVTALAKAAMKNKNENTLKAILSALWNLSAHCSNNKAEFCSVDGALAFLVDMLTYEGPSKTLKIIENAGGILRNVSSHIAVREDYRRILRQRNCLGILLQQLKSESLTVVSNACGTLWNLSARCPEDQKFLWDNGAVPMLRSLINSKHKMIAEGSSAALKNLLNFRPGILNHNSLDPIAKSMGLKELPTLNVRKQKALESELNPNLAETCENIDVVTPPKEKKDFLDDQSVTGKHPVVRLTRSAVVSKSESRDSLMSAKSDSIYEKLRRGSSAPPQSTNTNSLRSQAEYNTAVNAKSLNAFNMPRPVKNSVFVDEAPIDYSAKYNENISHNSSNSDVPENSENLQKVQKNETNYSTYQETDLDQPTDFSLRYAENQAESDEEINNKPQANPVNSNEIILILEDSVKCYQTEDTPYVISNAASITDLRNTKPDENVPVSSTRSKKISVQAPKEHNANPTVYGSGSYTPEKPINYCEEGTPGYFSRYESSSSLEESPAQTNGPTNTTTQYDKSKTEQDESILVKNMKKLDTNHPSTPPKFTKPKPTSVPVSNTQSPKATQVQILDAPGNVSKANNLINSAQETPLMFSRRSSMDSLVEEETEPMIPDDKSSVVSDFSRLASGVISPSDLPDSPTQSMPQSPRRLSNPVQFPSNKPDANDENERQNVPRQDSLQPLRSVFEDGLSTFQVENTPAQFSCATSLSNLSLDDEPKITTDSLNKELLLMVNSPKENTPSSENPEIIKSSPKSYGSKRESINISENEDEAANDDDLLAAAINSGMNRSMTASKSKVQNEISSAVPIKDVIRSSSIENILSTASKADNSSSTSVRSLQNNKDEIVHMSDISSNASDDCMDLFQQCIREGMQKSNAPAIDKNNKIMKPEQNVNISPSVIARINSGDPIGMLRRGGLPPYIPSKDEMNKFLVEDSPCNFSVISGLSNLTVGSGKAGPANAAKLDAPNPNFKKEVTSTEPGRVTNDKKSIADDSLSSISIESEDDSNLLSQAIAAGYNRPKSNLGQHKQSGNVTQPQPIPRSVISNQTAHFEPTDSLSSVDSSDSNDNQAKSLFEQCIQSGMNKSIKNKKERSKINQTLAINTVPTSPKRSQLPTLSNIQKTPLQMDRERQRERERKDEQLLKECITTGMTSKASVAPQSKPNQNMHGVIKLPTRHVRQIINPIELSQRLVTGSSANNLSSQPPGRQHQSAIDVLLTAAVQQQLLTQQHQQNQQSKNGETTSVVVLEQHQNHQQLDKNNTIFKSATSTAPDVVAHQHPQLLNSYQLQYHEVRESPEGTSTEVRSPASTPAAMSTPQGLQTVTPIVTTAATSPTPHNRSLSPTIPHISQFIQQQDQYQLTDYNNISNDNHQKNTHIVESTITGFNNFDQKIQGFNKSMISSTDINILEQSNEFPALKLSIVDSVENSVNVGEPFDMEISNEFLIDKINESPNNSIYDESVSTNNIIQDKHKDPDLMLKSVERLTQELVATAEYLRNNPDCVDFDSVPISLLDDKKTKSESNSNSNNNTWNENTCPNDVSFPSVSITAPIISSMNEDETTVSDGNILIKPVEEINEIFEKTPTNEFAPHNDFNSLNYYEHNNQKLLQDNSQPNSIDAETYTLVAESDEGNKTIQINDNDSISNGIQFIVGGEVKLPQMTFSRMNHLSVSGPMSLDTSSTMTNSTIIAMEATKLANNLMRNMMTDSATSLDLENIRPPSCMESLSMSGCYEVTAQNGNTQQLQIPQSPQLSRLRKKSLPAGLMARRALGCSTHLSNGHSGSLESVNSSYNLDNVKPPSLMDELLDSMISVASITSEIVDNSLGTNITNYETAVSDGDEQTTTLQSCMDGLPTDSNDDSTLGTPIPSDFSSVESTPRKDSGVKRMLTPKQKRKMVKDRFKTYTVAADFVLKENFQEDPDTKKEAFHNELATEEILQIEIEDGQDHKISSVDKNGQLVKDSILPQNIRREEGFNNSVSSPEQSPAERSPSINKKRRNLDPDRFKTRTITYTTSIVASNEVVGRTNEFESLTSTEDDSEEMSSIRALTKQFKFITQPESIDTNFTTLSQRSAIPIKNAYLRMRMLEDETRTITPSTIGTLTAESDYNSMEFDQNSETESCCDQKKNGNPNQTTDEEDELSPKRKSQVSNPTLIKAHIVKPGDKDSGTDLNFSEDPSTPPETASQPKAIRGRKKPAYVSPYKKSVLSAANSTSSTRTTSPKSQIGNTIVRANLASKIPDIKKNIAVAKHNPKTTTIVAKTHILLNKANLTNKINAIKTGLTKPGFTSSGQVNKKMVAEKNIFNKKLNLTKQIKNAATKEASNIGESGSATSMPLERQGTFVKDEPCNETVPIVGSLPTSPIKTRSTLNDSKTITNCSNTKPSNIPKSPNKVVSTTNKARPMVQKSSSTTSANILINAKSNKIGAASSSRLSITTSKEATTTQQRKNSLIGVRKCPSVPTVPQRSNSNASLRPAPSVSGLRTDIPATQPPSRSNSNLTPGTNKISQIGSRIAGIWKRVEESKKNSAQAKQNVNSSTKASTQDLQHKAQNSTGVRKPPSGSIQQPGKLIRSSTFDNSPSIGTGSGANKKLVATKISHKV
ncbi:uncharacterized protein LOC129610948 isoform X2 [Condylostylus longicornis]|uniref:uncharacterized protein LOC129610948 isoform X2 n=1 Tax=Condylostylus longicornis TaxID=2530218 RepID=UPI00244DB950|nr:uncharacterized protein LOC129610948 isoform X2 [Condylostylus longicornis]